MKRVGVFILDGSEDAPRKVAVVTTTTEVTIHTLVQPTPPQQPPQPDFTAASKVLEVQRVPKTPPPKPLKTELVPEAPPPKPTRATEETELDRLCKVQCKGGKGGPRKPKHVLDAEDEFDYLCRETHMEMEAEEAAKREKEKPQPKTVQREFRSVSEKSENESFNMRGDAEEEEEEEEEAPEAPISPLAEDYESSSPGSGWRLAGPRHGRQRVRD